MSRLGYVHIRQTADPRSRCRKRKLVALPGDTRRCLTRDMSNKENLKMSAWHDHTSQQQKAAYFPWHSFDLTKLLGFAESRQRRVSPHRGCRSILSSRVASFVVVFTPSPGGDQSRGHRPCTRSVNQSAKIHCLLCTLPLLSLVLSRLVLCQTSVPLRQSSDPTYSEEGLVARKPGATPPPSHFPSLTFVPPKHIFSK